MSMTTCKKCGDVYDSDFQFEVDKNGDCICDRCFEKLEENCKHNFKYSCEGHNSTIYKCTKCGKLDDR